MVMNWLARNRIGRAVPHVSPSTFEVPHQATTTYKFSSFLYLQNLTNAPKNLTNEGRYWLSPYQCYHSTSYSILWRSQTGSFSEFFGEIKTLPDLGTSSLDQRGGHFLSSPSSIYLLGGGAYGRAPKGPYQSST